MSILTRIMTFMLSMMLTITGWVGKMPVHTLQINRWETYQTNEGFGTSAAWWAQNIEDEAEDERIAALLYNKETGLGLDIFRFNVGGGEKENPDSVVAIESRKAESFWVWNEATESYAFDFTRDANAVRMMDLAVQNGASKIILFCNSPHFSLTENGRASGSAEEGRCNLPPENYGAFVDYLLTVAEHFVSLGYPIYGISPINEPQWNWGTGWVSQEGCHYSAEEAVALLECFAEEMIRRDEPFKLLCPESGQMDWNDIAYEEAFFGSELLMRYCDTYSGHSYWLDGNTEQKNNTASADFQSVEAGLVDVVDDEEDLYSKIRALVDFLPANNYDVNDVECTDDLNRTFDNLEGFAGDTAEALKVIADDNDFFEIKSAFASEMVTGFIRLDGVTVGCVANRSEILPDGDMEGEKFGTVLTTAGCYKAEEFIKFCDAFEIPVLSLTNVTGYEATVASEKTIARAAAKLTAAFASASVPKVNVIVGKAFGTAANVMNSKAIGCDITIAWPGSKIGTMDSKLAAKIMYEGQGSDVIDAKAKEYEELTLAAASAARRGYVDQIIEPADTRKYVIGAFEMLLSKQEISYDKKHVTI